MSNFYIYIKYVMVRYEYNNKMIMEIVVNYNYNL